MPENKNFDEYSENEKNKYYKEKPQTRMDIIMTNLQKP